MMHNRIRKLSPLMPQDGAIFVSIDKHERQALEHVLSEIFGDDNQIEELIWAMNTNNSQAPNYSTNHEYVLVYAKDRVVAEQDKSMFREPKPGYAEVMELVARLNPDYPPIAAIEDEIRKLYQQHQIEYREQVEAEGLDWEDEKKMTHGRGCSTTRGLNTATVLVGWLLKARHGTATPVFGYGKRATLPCQQQSNPRLF